MSFGNITIKTTFAFHAENSQHTQQKSKIPVRDIR